jgi:hypothetical protein
MKTYFLNSLETRNCRKNTENVLKNLSFCDSCKNIAIPTYKSFYAQTKSFCKSCYKKSNFTEDSLITPSKLEFDLIDKLVISCKNQNCELIFNVNTLENLINHQKDCVFNISGRKIIYI